MVRVLLTAVLHSLVRQLRHQDTSCPSYLILCPSSTITRMIIPAFPSQPGPGEESAGCLFQSDRIGEECCDQDTVTV